MPSATLFDLAAKEVVDLHDFFVRWFVDDGSAAPDFARFEAAMGPEFTMVPPEGAVLRRDAVVEHVRAARGTVAADFRIAIEEIWSPWQDGDAIILCYVEVQWRNGGWSRRRSSVLLSQNSSAPGGVLWRHLHETWMQMPE